MFEWRWCRIWHLLKGKGPPVGLALTHRSPLLPLNINFHPVNGWRIILQGWRKERWYIFCGKCGSTFWICRCVLENYIRGLFAGAHWSLGPVKVVFAKSCDIWVWVWFVVACLATVWYETFAWRMELRSTGQMWGLSSSLKKARRCYPALHSVLLIHQHFKGPPSTK